MRLMNRPFRLNTEAYYKYLTDVVPYEVDNVRLRYYATNSATAYAAGFEDAPERRVRQGAWSRG
ncbi:MAG: hypothetical protein WKG07_29900 [Hymenobacter sp.]